MGLPDEGFGLSRKRFRLGLNSKRKRNLKEPLAADDQSNPVVRGSSDMTGTTHHAFVSKEGKHAVYSNNVVNSPQPKDPLVAPVSSLYNIGNTCYLNCILQTLRYTPGFVKNLAGLKDILRVEESRCSGKDSKGKGDDRTSVWKLVESLDELFRRMRSKESDYTDLCPTDAATMSIRPDALLDEIRKFNPLFEENYQHDAQELLRCLLGCLDDAETELEKLQARKKELDAERENTSLFDARDNDLPKEKGKKNEQLDNSVKESPVRVPKESKRLSKKRKSNTKLDTFFCKKMSLASKVNHENSNRDELCNREDKIHHVTGCGDAGPLEKAVEEENLSDNRTGSGIGVKSSFDGKDCVSKSSNSPLKEDNCLHLKKNKVPKSGMPEDEGCIDSQVIVISSGDESDDLKKSPLNDKCAKSVVQSISQDSEITKECLSPRSVRKTSPQKMSPRLKKNDNDGFNSDTEQSLSTSDQNGKQHLISPGKHLTIHSPHHKAARKILDFSTIQCNDPLSSQKPGIQRPVSQNDSQDAFSSGTAVLPSQRSHDAKLLLKRCDWLGVSPVKSVSANNVLEQIKNESDTLLVSASKRKLNFDSCEDAGKKNCDMSNVSSSDVHNIKKDGKFQIKPFSIRLKKLDWLETHPRPQSFNVQEIYNKDDVGAQNLGSSKDGDYCDEASKKVAVVRIAHLGCQEKPKSKGVQDKLVQGLFGGVMGHRTCCCQCEKTSNRSETFLDVSIPVRVLSTHSKSSDEEDDDNQTDSNSCVYKLLQSLSTRERLCNDNKYFCDQCFTLVEAERFCFFQELPKVLAIHLKRFDAGLGSFAGYVSKISDHVSVPEHLPCLIPWCKNPRCFHRYSLYAVVTHSGSSILHGHYRSYVKVTSSFNKQLNHFMNDQDDLSSHVSHSFSQSSAASRQSDSPVLNNNNNNNNNNTASTTSLIGSTVEDITEDSFTSIDKRCDNSLGLASMSSKCGLDVGEMKEEEEKKSWWLECDDESIRAFEEDDFLDKLSEDNVCSLLGTPYILFYHQNGDSL